MGRWRAMMALAVLAGVAAGCSAGTSSTGEIDESGTIAPPTSALPATDETASAAWPDEVLTALADAGPEAVAWQRCWLPYATATSVQRATGVYDPRTGTGVLAEQDFGSGQQRYLLQDGQMTRATFSSGSPVWEPAADRHPTELELAPLRTVTGVRSLFDLAPVAPDPVHPERSRPWVQELPAPAGEGIGLRLEGLPDAWPRFSPDDADAPARTAAGALVPYGGVGLLWLVDVWADGGGRVERLRFQTQDQGPAVTELRFLPVDEVLDPGSGVRLPDCPAVDGEGDAGWRWHQPWTATRTVPLRVTLDPGGRPYEVSVRPGERIERADAATLVVPSAAADPELLVMDGNAVQVDPSFFLDEAVPVTVAASGADENGNHRVDVDVLWQVMPEGRTVLGLWLGPADAAVVAWDDLEYAYGTDGGVGGVTTRSVVTRAAQLTEGDLLVPDPDYGADLSVYDLDGIPGDDSIVFANGFGDGGFPLARGRNAAGQVVAVVIWRDVAGLPWRLAVPVGRPPATVTALEQAMIECLAGTRSVNPDGSCAVDPEDTTGD